MSSLVRRIQKGSGNHIGLLTSYRASWGARLGVTNPDAKDRLARLAREEKRASNG